MEALAEDTAFLDGLDGWGVLSVDEAAATGVEGYGSEGEDESFDDDDEDDGFTWTVNVLEGDEDGTEGEDPSAPAPTAARAVGTKDGKIKAAGLRDGSVEADLLRSLPDYVIRQLAVAQQEADIEEAKLKPEAQRQVAARRKTHRKLKIIAGSAANRRILSPQGDQTRPMMEMVRNAVFNMIASLYGLPGTLPEGTRWLDLFAGTGAIGIEALSRGCDEAHFIELSPWVVSNCLLPNLQTCQLDNAAVVHTMRAEDFLARGAKVPRFAGGAFDFISVCPPYELVSYPELYDLLEVSPLLHAQSVVLVEYPKKLVAQVRDTIGPLVKLRDRRYGRTYIALYGPPGADE